MRAPRFPTRVHTLNLLAGLWLVSPAAVLAQTAPQQPPSAPPPALADVSLASAPAAPLAYQGIAPQPALADAAPTATSWRDAHAAVAAFPRGHADIVAWEAHHTALPAAAPPPLHPPGHTAHPHSGSKP